MAAFNIKHRVSAPGHSRGNAIVERSLQTLQEKIGIYATERRCRSDRDLYLPAAVLAMNSCVHEATHYSPYEMTFGRALFLRQSQLKLKLRQFMICMQRSN